MNPLRRFQWWFTGMAAEIVVEDYDSVGAAIILPVTMGAMTVLAGFAAMNTPLWVGVLAGLFGAILALFTLIALYGTYLYTTERTEPLVVVGQ